MLTPNKTRSTTRGKGATHNTRHAAERAENRFRRVGKDVFREVRLRDAPHLAQHDIVSTQRARGNDARAGMSAAHKPSSAKGKSRQALKRMR